MTLPQEDPVGKNKKNVLPGSLATGGMVVLMGQNGQRPLEKSYPLLLVHTARCYLGVSVKEL